MSRFWQLFRPALARKAGQLNPQTLVGSLVARYGTSRSKSGKQFSLSAMTLRTQAASVCDNTCSVSTQQHRRSEHIVISQGNAVMFCQRIVLFRAKGNNCITHAAAAPSNLDLQRLSCKTQKNYSQRRRQLQLQNRILTPKRRKDDFEALFKRKLQAPKMRKSADKSLSQPWCSHSNTQCQVSQFYLSVTRKYCFPTSFDNTYCT